MCCNHEQRESGSADMGVWRSCDPLDPIKLKAFGVIWLNSSLVSPFFDYLLYSQCLLLTTVPLNAPWGTGFPVKMLDSTFILVTDNTTHQINR